eukprot:s4557_g1.t1
MAQRAAAPAELSGRVVGLPSLVGQAIALQGPDASQKRASVRAGAAVSLTPSLAKIANKDVVVELRGLPQAPPFKVGGRSGNAVTSSQSSKIHRGWRIVAVCGQRVPAEEVPAALSTAQKSAKYTVTFRLSTEEESKEKDHKESQDEQNEREQARLREEESKKERERMEAMEQERLEREMQEEKKRLALAEAEAKALQLAREAAEKSLEKSTGLPARDKVQEPQKALLAALAPTAPAAGKPVKPVAKPNGPCDKCDGPHATDDCPHFKKPRDEHKDAYENYQKGSVEGVEEAAEEAASEKLPKSVRVLPQPGDGSCLFHSLSHGLKKGPLGASALRAEIADYIAAHPQEEVAGNPIADWVLWDSGKDPKAYALSMREGSRWGGAMEIALCAKLHRIRVDIFERRSDHFLRIASFGEAEEFEPVRLLYGGRVHYDALEV